MYVNQKELYFFIHLQSCCCFSWTSSQQEDSLQQKEWGLEIKTKNLKLKVICTYIVHNMFQSSSGRLQVLTDYKWQMTKSRFWNRQNFTHKGKYRLILHKIIIPLHFPLHPGTIPPPLPLPLEPPLLPLPPPPPLHAWWNFLQLFKTWTALLLAILTAIYKDMAHVLFAVVAVFSSLFTNPLLYNVKYL